MSSGAFSTLLLGTADTLVVGNIRRTLLTQSTQPMSGNTFTALLSTLRPDQFLIEENDTGLDANRQATPHSHGGVAIHGRVEVLVPALSADRTWTRWHTLCTKYSTLQAVGIETLSSVWCSSSSALSLSARPRSHAQDAPPPTTSILPHAERARKHPHCVPLAAPRFRHLHAPNMTSSPLARS
jgi:hypothetical protein